MRYVGTAFPETPMPLHESSLRLDPDHLARAERLLARLSRNARLRVMGRLSRSGVLRLAMEEGLSRLEEEYPDPETPPIAVRPGR